MDKLIFASELLSKRIADITAAKTQAQMADTSPTLPEIEKTHMLFVNAHFKPFVMVGFEYARTKVQSGTVSLSSTSGNTTSVKFSIPQFGDFFSDMMVLSSLGQVSDTTVGNYKLNELQPVKWSVYPKVPNYNAEGDQMPLFSVSTGSLNNASGNSASTYSDDMKKAVALTDVVSRDKLAVRVQTANGWAHVLPWNSDAFAAALSAARNQLDGSSGSGDDAADTLATALTLSNGVSLNTVEASVVVEVDQEYVDNVGASVPIGENLSEIHSPWLRYCEWPGHRILNNVQFSVNNNILDEYNTEAYNMWEKFFLKADKRTGYMRLVGQEVEHKVQGCINDHGLRQVARMTNGLQTPAPSPLPPVHLWTPLLFWYSRDFRLAIPSVAIPYGQRFLDLKLASIKDLVYSQPANVFVVKKMMTWTQGEEEPAVLNDMELVSMSSYQGSPNVSLESLDLDLYINNLFVNSEIHDIFIKRVGFNLIRVFRQQAPTLTQANDEILLNELKWPIEYIMVGARPDSNNTHPDHWHRYGLVHEVPLKQYHATGREAGWVDSSFTFKQNIALMDRIGIKAHGVKIYDDEFTADFYSTYLPWRYGNNVVTPEDPGAHMINFCLYPGEYQPSGHINVSRAREFYFKYYSSVINNKASNGTPSVPSATLQIVASAIFRYKWLTGSSGFARNLRIINLIRLESWFNMILWNFLVRILIVPIAIQQCRWLVYSSGYSWNAENVFKLI